MLASALGAYFMQSYHVVIDASMMVNVLQSDPREASALLTPRLLMVVLVTLAVFQPLSSTLRNHKQLRYLINPLNSVYALSHLMLQTLPQRDAVLQPIGLDAQSPVPSVGQRPPLLVLVLGETARSVNFGLKQPVPARPALPDCARRAKARALDHLAVGRPVAANRTHA